MVAYKCCKCNMFLKQHVENMKENEKEKIGNLKRHLYENWKSEYITKEEYIEYKKKYEKDIDKIKEIIVNLDNQKEKEEKIID